MVLMKSERTPFELETELRAPVCAWISDRWPDSVVADEVGPRYAPTDLMVGVPGELANRVQSGPGPLDQTGQLALLSFLEQPRVEDDLRSWVRQPWSTFMDDFLRPLEESGLIGFDEATSHWFAKDHPREPFEMLVSIELKLKDWKRAIVQASLHRVFSDAAFIALPVAHISDLTCEIAQRYGIGVLAVEAMTTTCRVEPEHRAPVDPVAQRLNAETLLAAHLGLRDTSYCAGSPRGRAPAMLS